MHENVGCYSCHEDKIADGVLVLTHDYTLAAIGDEMGDGIAPAIAVCGQCHTEYYFKPENKATNVPYTDIASMDPAAELAYYDEMGFADWVQESTGTPLLKAQHPEIETVLGEGSVHAKMGLSCADCHMEKAEAEDGSYKSHYLQSPLNSEAILETCAACHKDTDMAEKVHAVQAEVTARETEVGEKLSALKDKLAEAVAGGEYSEEELDEIRKLHRTAQWFFDYDYVENSEGAHNSTLAKKCLDTAEAVIDEAMEKFKS
jgi:nitrite reductase (cytochrome c-552)